MYQYNAFVTSVYDGDSITCNIDLGFNMSIISAKIRLYGIDTPEIRNENLVEKKLAYQARDYLRQLILNEEIHIITRKPKDKYGRYLADIYFNDYHINEMMIDSGHAKSYFGGKKPRHL